MFANEFLRRVNEIEFVSEQWIQKAELRVKHSDAPFHKVQDISQLTATFLQKVSFAGTITNLLIAAFCLLEALKNWLFTTGA